MVSKIKQSIYSKKLLSFCALIMALSYQESWTATIEEAAEVILPCVPPTGYRPQSGIRVNSDYFDNGYPDQEARETILRRVDPGRDARKRVERTDEFPYSAQVYFVVTFPDTPKGQCEIGSGTFIHPSVILTAGHVVYSHKYGGVYKSLKCSPAQNEGVVPFDLPRVKGVKVAREYVDLEDEAKREHDYALVFIDKPIGKQTGNLGVVALNNKKLDQLFVNIYGYPSDKINEIERPTMWGMSGNLCQIARQELHYPLDTYGGQSGSGIWYQSQNNYYLVGVHAYGKDDADFPYNHGPRITLLRGEKIKKWIPKYLQNPKGLDNVKRVAMLNEEINKRFNSTVLEILPDEENLPLQILMNAKIKNNPKAQYEIGLMYLNAQGVVQNDEKALFWIEKAAQQNYIEAQIKLSIMYKYGKGVTEDEEKAIKWLKFPVSEGNAEAQYLLANIYYGTLQMSSMILNMFKMERGKFENITEAIRLYKLAAIKGHVQAQATLGGIYEGRGRNAGVPEDPSESMKWYTLAAEQGDMNSQYTLGEIYYGINNLIFIRTQFESFKDITKAFKWFKLAADQGHERAQNKLKEILEKGQIEQVNNKVAQKSSELISSSANIKAVVSLQNNSKKASEKNQNFSKLSLNEEPKNLLIQKRNDLKRTLNAFVEYSDKWWDMKELQNNRIRQTDEFIKAGGTYEEVQAMIPNDARVKEAIKLNITVPKREWKK